MIPTIFVTLIFIEIGLLKPIRSHYGQEYSRLDEFRA